MTTPTTAAGRALLYELDDAGPPTFAEDIALIEAEARQQERERIREWGQSASWYPFEERSGVGLPMDTFDAILADEPQP